MFQFFRKSPIVSSEVKDWVDAQFEWRMNSSKLENWDLHKLVTPSYFDFKGNNDHAQVTHVFHQLKDLLQIHNDVRLKPMQKLGSAYRDRFEHTTSTGLFISDGKGHLIEYDPEFIAWPISIINTLAHELMHLKLQPFIQDMPGGQEEHEQSTDIQVIIHGHGISQMEAATAIGWAGYLRQPTRAYAIAKFCAYKNISLEKMKPHLSASNFKLIKRAYQELS